MSDGPTESKWLRTDVEGTKKGGMLEVRRDAFGREVGIIDPNQEVSIYWLKEDTEKIIEKLKEVVE